MKCAERYRARLEQKAMYYLRMYAPLHPLCRSKHKADRLLELVARPSSRDNDADLVAELAEGLARHELDVEDLRALRIALHDCKKAPYWLAIRDLLRCIEASMQADKIVRNRK